MSWTRWLDKKNKKIKKAMNGQGKYHRLRAKTIQFQVIACCKNWIQSQG